MKTKYETYEDLKTDALRLGYDIARVANHLMKLFDEDSEVYYIRRIDGYWTRSA